MYLVEVICQYKLGMFLIVYAWKNLKKLYFKNFSVHLLKNSKLSFESNQFPIFFVYFVWDYFIFMLNDIQLSSFYNDYSFWHEISGLIRRVTSLEEDN